MPSPRDPTRPRPPPPADDWALFLDVDGCLLEIADAPDAVVVPEGLRARLVRLAARLEGALALVSGRDLREVDALFAPLRLPVAGLHGLQRRHGTTVCEAPAPAAALRAIRDEAARAAVRFPGAVVEDKGAALALHWRMAPAAENALQAFALAALPRLPGYRLQHGSAVVELRPQRAAHGGDADKGGAITAFLDEAPFAGRRPAFAGDDLTDEAGFAVVNARSGVSILVGGRRGSAARFALRDPADVLAWLGEAP